jgi:hypothetical protein
LVEGAASAAEEDVATVEDGMVTAEAAVVSVALMAVVVALLGLLTAGALTLWAQAAARDAARLVARGEPVSAAEQVVATVPAAELMVRRSSGWVRVSVAVPVGGRGPLAGLVVRGAAATVDERTRDGAVP